MPTLTPSNPQFTSESITLILASDPTLAASLDAQIERHRKAVDFKIGAALSDVPSPMPAATLQRFFVQVLPSALFARRYERLRFLAGLGVGPASPGEELRAIATRYAGSQADAALTELKASTRDSLTAELAAVESKLGKLHDPTYEKELRPGWFASIDHRLAMISWLLAKRAELTDRIERLAPDATEPAKAAGAYVSRVVKNAGGREFLASRIAEARKIRGTFYASDPSGAELAELERNLGDLEKALASLGPAVIAPEPNSRAAELLALRGTTVERIGALRSEIDARQSKEIGEMVAAACGGDDSARANLVESVRAPRHVFPPDLAASLEWHGPASLSLDGLAAELLRQLHAVKKGLGIDVPDALS